MKTHTHIVLITGSFPPNFCGVGDYTKKVFEALSLINNYEIKIFHKSEWKLTYLFKYFNELIEKKSKIYHMQYPTEGYGYSLLPLFLVLLLRVSGKNAITTIHELSSRNRSAYIYTQFLIFFSTRSIVSNSLELKHARKFIFNKKKVLLIPIASNIKKSVFADVEFDKRTIDLAYFGHFRPIKGIEGFINAVSIIGQNFNVQLIGQVLHKYSHYFKEIEKKSKELKVNIIADKDENEVSDLLANVKIIYLPFPDGISSRRGTLLASIQNGCVVVSSKSNIGEFNEFFEKYIYLVDSDLEAATIIKKLLNHEVKPKDTSLLKGMFSWEGLVSGHCKLYNSLNK